MRNTFITCLLLISTFCNAQDSRNQGLDNGYGILKIDEPLLNIKPYLKTDDVGNYLFESEDEESAYQHYGEIDLKKAGLSKFLGLTVDRCEVFFNEIYNEKGEKVDEHVFGFTFYLKKSSDPKVIRSLADKLVEKYGECEPFVHPETGDLIRMDWFTEKTLLFVSLGVDSSTGEEVDYYLVEFIQGYIE